MPGTGHERVSRRLLLGYGVLTGVAMAMVAACAPAAAPTPTAAPIPTATAPPAAPSPTSAPQATAPIATQAPSALAGEVSFGTMANGPAVDYHNKVVIPGWQKSHPNVKLTLTQAVYAEYSTKLLAQIAGGTTPDVFVHDDWYVPSYAARGVLKELTDYIKRDATALKDLVNQQGAQDVQGKSWGVSRMVVTVALLYNKTLFEQAGLKPPDQTWNWQKFLDAARVLTRDKAGKHPNEAGFDRKNVDVFGFWSRDDNESDWSPAVFGNKGSFVDPTGKQAVVNQPANVEAFEFMIGLIHKENVAPTKSEVGSFGNQRHIAFLSGKCAMMNHKQGQEAAWAPELAQKVKFDVGLLPVQKVQASPGWGHMYMMAATAKNVDVAWEFIRWNATTPEIAEGIYTVAQYGLPALRTTWDSPSLLGAPRIVSNIQAWFDPWVKGYASPDTLRSPVADEFVDAVDKQISLAYEGKLSVKDALDTANKDAQAALDRFYKK